MTDRDLLDDPAQRRDALNKMAPDRTTIGNFHETLLEIFHREMTYRDSDQSDDPENNYFEQLYWCGLLLYLVGDPADVPLMWKAKNINMDTGCGFDVQFLVGAGVQETIRYLETRGEIEILEYLKECDAANDFDDMPRWEEYRIKYFYQNFN